MLTCTFDNDWVEDACDDNLNHNWKVRTTRKMSGLTTGLHFSPKKFRNIILTFQSQVIIRSWVNSKIQDISSVSRLSIWEFIYEKHEEEFKKSSSYNISLNKTTRIHNESIELLTISRHKSSVSSHFAHIKTNSSKFKFPWFPNG